MNQSGPERNRAREKHRRDALKESIESLQGKLLQHDETFRQESHRRTLTTASRVAHTAKSVTNSAESWSFTKVEIINQAIHTIDEVMAQNQEMKILLLEIAKHPAQVVSLLEAAVDLPSRSRAGFHQGVGPLVTVPTIGAPAQEEQISKKRKHEDTTTVHTTRNAASSTATEPMWTSIPDARAIFPPTKPNNPERVVHHSLGVRESDHQQPPASTTDNLHAQAVADQSSVTALQRLLVGASFQNRHRQIPSYPSTLGLTGQDQLQSRMSVATTLAAIQHHIQPPPTADNSATIRNLLPRSTSITSALPFLGSSLVQFPTFDPNLLLERPLLAAEYEQYRGALPTTNTHQATLQSEKASFSGQDSNHDHRGRTVEIAHLRDQ